MTYSLFAVAILLESHYFGHERQTLVVAGPRLGEWAVRLSELSTGFDTRNDLLLALGTYEKQAGDFCVFKIDSSATIVRAFTLRLGIRHVRGCDDPRHFDHAQCKQHSQNVRRIVWEIVATVQTLAGQCDARGSAKY